MKYSIIIPVYNAEKYIDECILSVLNQKGSYELILVDDGSKDQSGEICDGYSCENVSVYHIENSGPGRARNFGAEQAKGDFLIFMDADDYISESFFEKLETSDVDFNADVIFFDAIKVFQDGSKTSMSYGIEKSGLYKKSREEAYKHLSECNKFPATCWGKLIRREFYEDNKICVDETIYDEDIDWAMLLITNARCFDWFTEGFYYYRINKNSRSSWGKISSVTDQLKIIEKWKKKLENSKYEKYFLSILAYQYAMVFPYFGALKKEEKKKIRNKMKQFAGLLKYGKTKKVKAICLLTRIFGIGLSSVILYNFVYYRQK